MKKTLITVVMVLLVASLVGGCTFFESSMGFETIMSKDVLDDDGASRKENPEESTAQSKDESEDISYSAESRDVSPTPEICTEHVFSEWEVQQQPTCMAEGNQQRACRKCGYSEQQTLPKSEHTVVVDKSVPATCSDTGLTEGEHCTVCSTVIIPQNTVAKLAHKFGNWEIVTASNCTSSGSKKRTCANCGETQTEALPVGNHSYVNGKCQYCGEAQPATENLTYKLSQDGTYYICTGCSYSLTPKTIVVPAYYNGKPVKEFSGTYGSVSAIILPEGLEVIGNPFFFNCTMTEIAIPASVRYISASAFDTAELLERVYIPTSNWFAYVMGSSYTQMDFSDPIIAANVLRNPRNKPALTVDSYRRK